MTDQDGYNFPTWEPDIAQHHRKSYVFRVVTSYSETQPFPFVGLTRHEIEQELNKLANAAVIAAEILYPENPE